MQNAKKDILANCSDAHVDTIQMDLADLGADSSNLCLNLFPRILEGTRKKASVSRAAEEIAARSFTIDILVANAGVVYHPVNWLYLTNSVQGSGENFM